jgi:serine/threonine protein phosphatase 1
MITCAIGDIHGRFAAFEVLLDRCRQYCGGRDMRLVFVGDYVDRGPDSAAVVESLMDLQRRLGDRVICLRGNHEEVVLAAADDDLSRLGNEVDWDLWMANGGRETLASYGVDHARALPPDHLAWMASLPSCHDDGLRFFAHAGINPELPIDAQQDKDLLWIREPFLSDGRDYGRLIVHGHTPVKEGPDLRANRLNLDTGAGYGRSLTAALFDDTRTEPLVFLTSPV